MNTELQTAPVLRTMVQVTMGDTNIQEFEAKSDDILKSISMDLNTDDDFAQAEQDVKMVKGIRTRIKDSKDELLAQTGELNILLAKIDDIDSRFQKKGSELTKKVTDRKTQIKTDIVQDYTSMARDLLDSFAGETDLHADLFSFDFNQAIKNKRSIISMRQGCDAVLADLEVAVNDMRDTVATNKTYIEKTGHKDLFLFDLDSIVTKAPADFKMLADARIATHQANQRAEESAKTAEQAAPVAEQAAPVVEQPAAAPAEPVQKAPAFSFDMASGRDTTVSMAVRTGEVVLDDSTPQGRIALYLLDTVAGLNSIQAEQIAGIIVTNKLPNTRVIVG